MPVHSDIFIIVWPCFWHS